MSIRTLLITLLSMLMFHSAASADGLSYFDFNDVPITKKKFDSASYIESYMESVYGSNIVLGPQDRKGRARVTATNNPGKRIQGMHLGNSDTNPLGILAPATQFPDMFLMSGKGKNSGIVITFGDAPIHSFSVDWQLFKNARGLTIRAGGEIVFEQGLTKAQRKQGFLGHQDTLFFDDPVYTLEFIGWKKSKFGIDNLVVNFSLPGDSESPGDPLDPSEPGSLEGPGETLGESTPPAFIPPAPASTGDSAQPTESIPEPGTFILLAVGLVGILALPRLASRTQPARQLADKRREREDDFQLGTTWKNPKTG